MKNKVVMSREGFVKEHKSLIKKLRKGTKSVLNGEAKKQQKEINKYL